MNSENVQKDNKGLFTEVKEAAGDPSTAQQEPKENVDILVHESSNDPNECKQADVHMSGSSGVHQDERMEVNVEVDDEVENH